MAIAMEKRALLELREAQLQRVMEEFQRTLLHEREFETVTERDVWRRTMLECLEIIGVMLTDTQYAISQLTEYIEDQGAA